MDMTVTKQKPYWRLEPGFFFIIIASISFSLLTASGQTDSESAVVVLMAVAVVILLRQRWLWVLVFGIGALASAFACMASIFRFQILGALGFFFLVWIMGFIAAAIFAGYSIILTGYED